VLVQTLKKIKT